MKRLASGTQPIPHDVVVVEKVVRVVVEPRVVQVLVLPETAVEEAPVSASRARRITDAYQPADPVRKPLAIA